MNEKVGNVSFNNSGSEYNFQKPYSEETGQLIDEEVRALIARAYDRTKALLLEQREGLNIVANALLEKEVLFRDDLAELVGERPFNIKEDKPKLVEEETSHTSTEAT